MIPEVSSTARRWWRTRWPCCGGIEPGQELRCVIYVSGCHLRMPTYIRYVCAKLVWVLENIHSLNCGIFFTKSQPLSVLSVVCPVIGLGSTHTLSHSHSHLWLCTARPWAWLWQLPSNHCHSISCFVTSVKLIMLGLEYVIRERFWEVYHRWAIIGEY